MADRIISIDDDGSMTTASGRNVTLELRNPEMAGTLKCYRKRPVTVATIIVTDPASALLAAMWMEECGFLDFEILDGSGAMRIGTLEGNKEFGVPFVLIRGVVGEFYPCDCGVFTATYESV